MSRDETPTGDQGLVRVVPYCEPIYRYCVRRLGDTQRAEDLAQEILAEALEGVRRGAVRNLDAWIWTVARNRYRRLFAGADAVRDAVVLNIDDLVEPSGHSVEQDLVRAEGREQAFRAVVGIAEMYRRVLIAYHVHGDSYEEIARRLSIPMSSVKWRIHEGRRRLRERWEQMTDEGSRVYDRIDWRIGCNGSMDPDRYLGRQIRRAITKAAYAAPLTVEEISRTTAIPAVYIEDEIDALLHGEALTERRGRYAANFIILGLDDHRRMTEALQPRAEALAETVMDGIRAREVAIRAPGFQGSDRPLLDLLWILVPRVLRAAVIQARRGTPELQGDYPERQDGGRGWFVIAEDSQEDHGDAAGQNSYGTSTDSICFHYLWIGRYLDSRIDRVLHELSGRHRPGFIDGDAWIDTAADEALAARMLECGLAERCGDRVRLAVPLLRQVVDEELSRLLEEVAAPLAPQLTDLVHAIAAAYRGCTPERLHGQIRGVIGSALNYVVGMVVGRLEARGQMPPPTADRPHAKSVLAVRAAAT